MQKDLGPHKEREKRRGIRSQDSMANTMLLIMVADAKSRKQTVSQRGNLVGSIVDLEERIRFSEIHLNLVFS